MEKFCSDYKVYQRYPDCDTVDAFISYGNDNPYEFARQFVATHLTVEERKQKRRTMAITVGISILIMGAIILAITLIVSVQTAVDNRKNVYFDRYMPVDGNVGDEDVVYKLEISMVSDAMQPDDILYNYTGILK